MRRIPGIARMAEHIVVTDRAVGEFGEVEGRDLVAAGLLEARD